MFVRGCEKFVIALPYLFCLALDGYCLARLAYFLADLCSSVLRQQMFSEKRVMLPIYPTKEILRTAHITASEIANVTERGGTE